MKKTRSNAVLAFAAILIQMLEVSTAPRALVQRYQVRIEEYRLFHAVLEPLQHEALPQGDFQRIRSMASELVTRGKAIVNLVVPEAPQESRRKFAKAGRNFDKALARFSREAKNGTDASLKKSFAAVHDSFEQLADLVPSVYPGGMPPIVSVDCPVEKTEAGSVITLHADAPHNEEFLFTWTIDRGKIVSGQGTSTITVDTTGLSGQTISVQLETNDGNQHTTMTTCEVQIAASKQP